jgi:hypothetical protein
LQRGDNGFVLPDGNGEAQLGDLDGKAGAAGFHFPVKKLLMQSFGRITAAARRIGDPVHKPFRAADVDVSGGAVRGQHLVRTDFFPSSLMCRWTRSLKGQSASSCKKAIPSRRRPQ